MYLHGTDIRQHARQQRIKLWQYKTGSRSKPATCSSSAIFITAVWQLWLSKTRRSHPQNAEGNFIRNCLFETTDTAIQGHKDGGALNFGLFTTYIIIGCTFKGLPSGTPPVNSSRFFYMDRPAGDNQLINCVIMNYPNYRNVPVLILTPTQARLNSRRAILNR